MLNLFFSKKITGFSLSLLLAASVALLAGCGGGGAAAGAATAAPSITVVLTNSAGATITTISSDAPGIVKATVKDSAGAGIAGLVVTFSTDATLATAAPASALTDANGVATVALSAASLNAAGAATITATSKVGTSATAITGSTNYSVKSTFVSSVSSITVAMTNSAGAAVTSISSGAPAIVKATVKDTAGAGVANAIVTFSTDATLATIAPASKTALTDANGIATITLSAASLTAAGATTITATTQVGTAAITGSKGYSVGAASVAITPPAFGLASLSAFGTTSVSVTVSSNGAPVTTPQTVSFTSPCASSGKAVLTPSVATVNGIATASYRDNGCAGSDTVTASITGIASSSATLNVTAPATGSIQFVSATPTLITLKGMGGAGMQESSQVVFKVVDTAGNPIGGKTVNFSLSTAVGGIALATATAISDPTTGQVVVGINAGTVSTPVRVIASTCSSNTSPCSGTLLSTQSDLLTISTGIPDQQNFSLSATTLNIEGWNYDGTSTTLTVRVADHFNNPVPDGTVVNFVAEGGKINSTCSTTGFSSPPPGVPGDNVTEAGKCSVLLVSQALRPNNGRLTVLAYAVGEEGFTDLNGNGKADNPTEMIDANGSSTDMPEAFVDYNENGIRDANEPFIDFNQDGVYNSPDAKYNGVLCDANVAPGSSATACNAQKHTHVRIQMPIVFSGSDAVITINPTQFNPNSNPIYLPACYAGSGGSGAPGAPLTFTVTVVDLHGNAMPAGTVIDFSSDNGTITSAASYIVPSTSGCRPASAYAGGSAGCPASAASSTFGNISVTMKSDATWTSGTPGVPAGFSPPTPAVAATADTCKNTNANGTFTVKVTTPNKVITTLSQSVSD